LKGEAMQMVHAGFISFNYKRFVRKNEKLRPF